MKYGKKAFTIVEVIVTYVDGLPTPFSSSAFVRLASVYLAGG